LECKRPKLLPVFVAIHKVAYCKRVFLPSEEAHALGGVFGGIWDPHNIRAYDKYHDRVEEPLWTVSKQVFESTPMPLRPGKQRSSKQTTPERGKENCVGNGEGEKWDGSIDSVKNLLGMAFK